MMLLAKAWVVIQDPRDEAPKVVAILHEPRMLPDKSTMRHWHHSLDFLRWPPSSRAAAGVRILAGVFGRGLHSWMSRRLDAWQKWNLHAMVARSED